MITLKICLPNWSSLSNTNVHFCRYTKYERTRCYLNDYGISTKMSARKIRRTNRVGVESRSRLWCNIHGYKCEAFPLHVKVVGSSKTIIEMMGSIRNGVTRKIQKRLIVFPIILIELFTSFGTLFSLMPEKIMTSILSRRSIFSVKSMIILYYSKKNSQFHESFCEFN